MEELSFFEKLVVLYENILDHPLFILLFFVPIILLFLQKKHGKKVFIIAFFLVIFVCRKLILIKNMKLAPIALHSLCSLRLVAYAHYFEIYIK